MTDMPHLHAPMLRLLLLCMRVRYLMPLLTTHILENSVISDAKIDNILQTGQIMLQVHADRQIKKDYK